REWNYHTLPMYSQAPGTDLPSGQQVASYTASWVQFYYLTLCTRPQFSRELFEAWTVLKLLAFVSVELLTYQLNVLTSFGAALLHLPVLLINCSITAVRVLGHVACSGATRAVRRVSSVYRRRRMVEAGSLRAKLLLGCRLSQTLHCSRDTRRCSCEHTRCTRAVLLLSIRHKSRRAFRPLMLQH
ncbi:unnamed protein product, partial [Polarella glacialis]